MTLTATPTAVLITPRYSPKQDLSPRSQWMISSHLPRKPPSSLNTFKVMPHIVISCAVYNDDVED